MTTLLTERLEAAGAASADPTTADALPLFHSTARVDLMPPGVRERRAVAAVQKVTAGALVAVAVAVAGAWVLTHHGVTAARADLAATQSRGAGLQRQETAYAAAPTVIAQVDAAQAARASALADDVAWDTVLDRISRATPATVWLESETGAATGSSSATSAVGAPAAAAPAASATGTPATGTPATGTPAAGTAAAGTSPAGTSTGTALGASAVGTVTLTGDAEGYDGVAAYLTALGRVSGLTDPYLTTSSADSSSGSGVIAFTITASVTTAALVPVPDQEG